MANYMPRSIIAGLQPRVSRKKKRAPPLEWDEEIQLSEEEDYPTQVTEASCSDAFSIVCLRNNYGIPSLLQSWLVADNLHFGMALMAIEAVERLVQ
jgi:aspartate-semialdehyde dehydrogenase